MQIGSEEAHPGSGSGRGGRASSRNAYRFLRATYTAGSMAGLGFSMAVVGLSLGIFLGFLLWKRRIGLLPSYYFQGGAMGGAGHSPL